VSKPVVLVDCDGVLADFIGSALVIVNGLFDTSYVPEDVTQFSLAASLGLSEYQGAQMKRAIGNAWRLAADLKVLPFAKDGTRRLRDISQVYIVTSSWDSNETWEFDRKAWLRRHFDIGHHDIVFTAAKHLVRGDVCVDDKTSTLVEWEAAHPNGVAVQWQTPHNRRDTWYGPSTNSWDRLIRLVEESAQ
jgi:5'(3')-deoxyribonucleotidase